MPPSQEHDIKLGKLDSLKGTLPCELAMQPRLLKDLKIFKVTEFLTFLLYSGPGVLKGVLPDSIYKHALALNVDICILEMDDELCN